MACSTPKLKFALAKNALIHFFSNAYWTKDELNFMRSFLEENNSDKVLKLKIRLLAEENNDMLVAAVLADSSSEEFRFLYSKYRLGHSFVQISTELNVHPNGLQRWRDKFLAKIATLLEYNLPADDIFSRNKVEALVFVLERTIAFYETYGNADAEVLHSLKVKLNAYQNLLFAIKFFLASKSKQLAIRTIKTKILNQHVSLSELEFLTNSSHSSIAHYLNLFQRQFYSQSN